MSAKIKIGVVGLGLAWERLHAPAYARLKDQYEIVAVCDQDIHKAQSVAAWLGLPPESAYDHDRRMFARPDIDAVDIMVPITENYECTHAAIISGKHVIAEKPFASSPEAAQALIKLKKRMGVHVMVAENIRYSEESLLIKRLIDEGRIGDVVYFVDNHITAFQQDQYRDTFARTDWRQHPEYRGGVLLDSGVHHVARHRFLFGEARYLFAGGYPSNVDFTPYACVNALLTFGHGVSGHYSFYMTGKETQAPLLGLRIFGTEGEIYLEEDCCGFVNVSQKNGHHESIPYTPGEGYYRELDNFHKALTQGEAIVSTPEKELGDIVLIYGMMESIEKKSAVRIDSCLREVERGLRNIAV